MALLESPHPSPLFRTSLAIVEPFSPSPNPPSHHREPPDPLSIPIETLSPSPGPSHLSLNPSGRCLSIPVAVVDPSGRCETRFAVFEPVLPSSNPPAVVEPVWPLSILCSRCRTPFAVFEPVSPSSLSRRCGTRLAGGPWHRRWRWDAQEIGGAEVCVELGVGGRTGLHIVLNSLSPEFFALSWSCLVKVFDVVIVVGLSRRG